MTKEEKVQYWQELSDYDLDTAEAMFCTKRWLYVGFMCHQVLEKILKAYWCATQQDNPPFIHSLTRLVEGSGLMSQMEEQQLMFLDEMMPMNIEARYPSYKLSLAQGLNAEVCKQMINTTKELQLWIKNRL